MQKKYSSLDSRLKAWAMMKDNKSNDEISSRTGMSVKAIESMRQRNEAPGKHWNYEDSVKEVAIRRILAGEDVGGLLPTQLQRVENAGQPQVLENGDQFVSGLIVDLQGQLQQLFAERAKRYVDAESGSGTTGAASGSRSRPCRRIGTARKKWTPDRRGEAALTCSPNFGQR